MSKRKDFGNTLYVFPGERITTKKNKLTYRYPGVHNTTRLDKFNNQNNDVQYPFPGMGWTEEKKEFD